MRLQRQAYVSIPAGAIDPRYPDEEEVVEVTFQYQQVRLIHEAFRERIDPVLRVSIPAGAIDPCSAIRLPKPLPLVSIPAGAIDPPLSLTDINVT